MKTWFFPCANAIFMAFLSGMTTACSIDDTYDIDKDIDMTIGMGVNGLTLKLGSTEHVMLNDVLDIEDNDLIETDSNNLYYLIKSDSSQFDLIVENAIGSIENVEVNTSRGIVSFGDLDNPSGASSVLVARGEEFSKTNMNGSNLLEVNIDEISDEINSIKNIFPKSSVFDLKLEAYSNNSDLAFNITSVRNLTITFPDYVNATGLDENNSLHFEDMDGINASSIVIGEAILENLYFGEGDEGLGSDIEIDENGDRFLYLADDISMVGDFTVASRQNQYMEEDDTVKIRLFVGLQSGGRVEAERIQGEVDPEISPNIDPINISDDLPDFLRDNLVTLNAQNPTIKFNIDMSTVTIPIEFSSTVTAFMENGETTAIVNLPADGKNYLEAGKGSTIYYTQTGTPYDPNGITENSEVETVDNLSELINKIPDNFQVDCNDGRVNVKQHILHDVYLDHTYTADVDYEIIVPFQFNENTVIVYNDSIDGMNEDLKDYQSEGIEITAEAYNCIPMQLEVSIEPVDLYGNVLENITVTSDTIAASNGTDLTRTDITVTLDVDDPADVSLIDKLRFHVVSVSTASGELRSDQYFYLDNMRLKLKGQIIGDFN